MKKAISLILTIALLFSFALAGTFTLTAQAATVESGKCGTNLTWTLDSNGKLTISGTGDMTNYYGAYVPWNSYRTSIKEVIIGPNVTSIGEYAFYNCSSLTSIALPNSVTSISVSAFKNCTSLASITIPDSVTSIGGYAFSGCSSLTSVTIGNSVTSIGDYTFDGCSSLTSVTIGNSVTSIGEYAFSGCSSLTSITIPDSVTSIGEFAFYDCSSLTSIAIPETITYIGECAFADCTSLTSITIPDSVTSIGWASFFNCSSLTSITIPDSVTSIGNEAFYGCTSLTSIQVDSQNAVFHSNGNCLIETASKTLIVGCKTSQIPVDGSVTSIGNEAFSGCTSLTSITIPDSVTSIGWEAFSNCSSLTSITIPGSVTSIGYSAFYGCSSLTSITIPDSVTSIGGASFSNCSSLTSITIPDSVTSIGWEAFSNCSSLTSITIPGSVTSIGYSAFYGCTGLTSIAIPDSITSIGYEAFHGCTSLTSVIFCGIQERWDVIKENYGQEPLLNAAVQFHNYQDGVCTICQYDIDVSRDLYFVRNSTGDGYIVSKCKVSASGELVIPETYRGLPVTAIGKRAFANCSSLKSITIPDGITVIGNEAFVSCISLKNITIPNSVTDIGMSAFFLCNGLKSVTLSNSVTVIQADTFYGCRSLATVIYCGEQEQWNEIAVGVHNQPLTNATLQFHNYENSVCTICQQREESFRVYRLDDIEELAKETTVYVNGLPYEVKADGEGRYVELPKAKELLLVTYTYHEGDGQDVHTQYPTGMKVYLVKNGKITHIPELDNLLQYSGSSIRITGKKGIRMITSIAKDKKAALTGKGLAGYTVVEYGTTLCFANEIPAGDGLVLGRSYARSNYAYKKNVADPVFATTKDSVQYTNVLVGFSLDQCKDDIAMRPYIILKNAAGEQFTIYGGTIYRSIGYIAYQNRSVFQPKTASYNYVWEIIHHVYGDKYDADYKG